MLVTAIRSLFRRKSFKLRTMVAEVTIRTINGSDIDTRWCYFEFSPDLAIAQTESITIRGNTEISICILNSEVLKIVGVNV